MLWNTAEGSGGLGVHGRVPGLVKPPSLVRSAVPLLLLHVEMHDMPRLGLSSNCSSAGELASEPYLSAEVRSDSLRSRTGFDFAKEAGEEDLWRFKGAGRWARGSGGSSNSPTASSSAMTTGGAALAMLCGVSIRNAPCLPTWCCSLAMSLYRVEGTDMLLGAKLEVGSDAVVVVVRLAGGPEITGASRLRTRTIGAALLR